MNIPTAKVSRVLGGGLVALFIALLIAALTFFGVISIFVGHVCMALAWGIGALLISTEILPSKPGKNKALAILVLGGMILFADRLIVKFRPPERQVIVTKIEVLPYVMGQPVKALIYVKHISDPDANYYGYWQMWVNRDVIVVGGSPSEQRAIEEKNWNDFLQATAKNATAQNLELSLPFGKEVSMPIVASFGDEDTRSLISGEKSLYITGVIEGTENQSETPYCAIKSPHMAGIRYCQSHN